MLYTLLKTILWGKDYYYHFIIQKKKLKFCKPKWYAYISTVKKKKIVVWINHVWLTSDSMFLTIFVIILPTHKICFQMYTFIFISVKFCQNLLSSRFDILDKLFFLSSLFTINLKTSISFVCIIIIWHQYYSLHFNFYSFWMISMFTSSPHPTKILTVPTFTGLR